MNPEHRPRSRVITTPIPNLPVFDHLGSPPGRWVKGKAEGTCHWEGLVSWITRHGQSSIRWYMGEVISVWNVKTDEGKTAEVVTLAAPYHHNSWRCDDAGSLKTGWLELSTDGILFHENPAIPRRPAKGLVDILSVDGEFVTQLTDKAFADTVCGYLSEHVFRRIEDEGRMTFGARTAEDFILRLTGVEANRHNRDERAMVAFEEILEETGWHAMTPEELEIDRQMTAKLLLEIEGRADGAVAEESRATVIPMRQVADNSHFSRLLACVSAGKVSQIEIDRFASLDHPSATLSRMLRPAG